MLPRRHASRRVLAVCTVLMALGLTAAAIWPGGVPPLGPARAPSDQPEPPLPPEQEPKQQPLPPAPATLEDLPADQPSRLVVNGSRSCPMIALTYDAGSGADGAAAILDTLKMHQVTATFFLTGKWVETYPSLAKRIAAEGHEIANHTYSHPDLTKLTASQVIQQVRQGEERIRQVTGRETRPLFREPYGAFNEAERKLVRQAGFSYSIYWDVDTLDWQFPPLPTLVNRLATRPQNGSIVLMHLNVPETALASDQAIPLLRQKGYQLVTVTELLQCSAQKAAP
jgi:peptidoglycan/xylan/chitin deacetylase (PgdA/CDA1 family)